MSATSPQYNLREHRAAEPFVSDVWDNPEICNNCFTRCKTVTKSHYLDANSGEEYPVESHQLGREGIIAVADVSGLGAGPVHRERCCCKQCGSVQLVAQYDVLSQREAVERCAALAARLDEAGHTVDEQTLRHTVRHLKSKPRFQGADREIFAVASHLATK